MPKMTIEVCKACRGKKVNSNGNECRPCAGTGIQGRGKQEAKTK